MRLFYSVAVLFIALLASQSQAKNSFEKQSYLYVSLNNLRVISIYKIDNQNGDLLFVKSIPVSGSPGPLTIDPSKEYLHAAIGSNRTVSSFRIDQKSGDLMLLGSVDITWNPTYISTDMKGRYLFLTFFSDNKSSVFSIADNGAVKSGAIQVLSAELNPHSILIDKSNKFLFVPCRTAESIQQYKFDELSGKLVSNSPDKIATPDSTGPRHFVFHPFLDMVYVANEFGRSVTAYNFNTNIGILTKLQTLTMQPENPKNLAIIGNQGGADIKITPSGKFLYATNREPDKIVAYEIDPKTGLLTFIENYPTEKLPRSFDIDPSGNYIYVGGQNSGKIAAYRIDQSSGKLTQIKTHTVGNNPAWLTVIELDEANSVGINENNNDLPLDYTLDQNYPNPFNSQTKISYQLRTQCNVTLTVFDLLGRQIDKLVDSNQSAGKYEVLFDSSRIDQNRVVSSGVYFYKIQAGDFSQTKSMLVLE